MIFDKTYRSLSAALAFLIGATAASAVAENSSIAAVLQPFVDARQLAGAVTLVASPEKTLAVDAVGWADVGARKPMRADSVFWIASQSKPVTGAALMVLVDDGKVSVDDPVDKYLPEFKEQWVRVEGDKDHVTLRRPHRPILIRDLLTHTSGLPFKSAIEEPTLDLFPLATRVRSYAMLPLNSDPGTKSLYSNAGINTVGRIIEVVSGLPFERFLDERIFGPLGMKDTTFWPTPAQLARMAKSYKPVGDGLEECPITQLHYPLDARERQPMPAGGLFSTAQDLAIFYRMLTNDGLFQGERILSAASVRRMTTDQSGEAHSAYGFGIGTDGNTFTHGGAYNTNSRFDRRSRLITVFLVQHAGWAKGAEKIPNEFLKAARAAYAASAPAAGAGETVGAQRVVGIPPNAAATVKPVGASVASRNVAGVRPLVVIDRVRFFPAPGRSEAMLGGRFTGSNESATTGFRLLGEIRAVPAPDRWTELKLENTRPYRWIRYEAPAGSRGNVAEIEFYARDRKISGGGFGTPGSLAPGGHWKTVWDAKTTSWFNSDRPDAQYVGLDLGDQAAASRPAFLPAPGDFGEAQTIEIRCATAGAEIRYTLDGTRPDAHGGQRYTGPLRVAANASLTAVAFKEGIACSPAMFGTYWIGAARGRSVKSFHVGNSLTGNASRFPFFARTAGATEEFEAFLIGGATTFQIWNGKEGTERERYRLSAAKVRPPLDYFTLQPRDFDVAREADYDARFLQEVRALSPDVQPWLYVEWEEMGRGRPTDRGSVPSSQMAKTFPALTWEEGMSAMLLYNEEVQQALRHRDTGAKPVRILPTALAIGWARNLIDQRKFPGTLPGEASFYETLFEDHVHVNMNGCYLVALTWYAALYRESPEGKVLPLGTSLNAAQAQVLQRLAWDVVKNYPDCGLYESGSKTCVAPRIVVRAARPDGIVPIELSSSTPGTWFRYTLDGTEPTRTRGYVYCGVISSQPGITVKAVAYRSGMVDSAVAQLAME